MSGADNHGKSSKIRRVRIGFPHFRIRGSLFAAFAVIAGMTILISVGAGFSLHQLGDSMSSLSGQDIPKLAASQELATESERLASQAPILLDSANADQIKERAGRMKNAQQAAMRRLDDITRLGADTSVVAALTDTVKNIDDTIRSLGTAAQERLDLATRHTELYDQLRGSHDAFIAVAGPAMLDAQTQMNAVLGSAIVAGRR
jgi:phosphoglycerate-specific signal transduction histidine kinase